MEGKTKIYVFGAILIALIFLAFYLYKSGSKPAGQSTETQTVTGASGIFGALGSVIGNIHFPQNLNFSGIGFP